MDIEEFLKGMPWYILPGEISTGTGRDGEGKRYLILNNAPVDNYIAMDINDGHEFSVGGHKDHILNHLKGCLDDSQKYHLVGIPEANIQQSGVPRWQWGPDYSAHDSNSHNNDSNPAALQATAMLFGQQQNMQVPSPAQPDLFYPNSTLPSTFTPQELGLFEKFLQFLRSEQSQSQQQPTPDNFCGQVNGPGQYNLLQNANFCEHKGQVNEATQMMPQFLPQLESQKNCSGMFGNQPFHSQHDVSPTSALLAPGGPENQLHFSGLQTQVYDANNTYKVHPESSLVMSEAVPQGQGHYDCLPQQKNDVIEGSKSETSCGYCGRMGHDAIDCIKYDTVHFDKPVCIICNTTSHSIDDCHKFIQMSWEEQAGLLLDKGQDKPGIRSYYYPWVSVV